ncbi:MAG TPA: hypothetical protein VFH06_03190 [Candidatus Saccharimonadales bacterium]|nr:hypothetical protein [Candidatus Saccharimonadales bacterium]
MTEDTIDQLVLEALRAVAADGISRTIGGIPVRLASPQGLDCVYMRIANYLETKNVEVNLDTHDSVVQQYKALRDAIRRLSNANKVFINGEDPDEDSYWVATE